MEVKEYDKECGLSSCGKPGIFQLKWEDGCVLYLCREHFYELSQHLTEEDP